MAIKFFFNQNRGENVWKATVKGEFIKKYSFATFLWNKKRLVFVLTHCNNDAPPWNGSAQWPAQSVRCRILRRINCVFNMDKMVYCQSINEPKIKEHLLTFFPPNRINLPPHSTKICSIIFLRMKCKYTQTMIFEIGYIPLTAICTNHIGINWNYNCSMQPR